MGFSDGPTAPGYPLAYFSPISIQNPVFTALIFYSLAGRRLFSRNVAYTTLSIFSRFVPTKDPLHYIELLVIMITPSNTADSQRSYRWEIA